MKRNCLGEYRPCGCIANFIVGFSLDSHHSKKKESISIHHLSLFILSLRSANLFMELFLLAGSL